MAQQFVGRKVPPLSGKTCNEASAILEQMRLRCECVVENSSGTLITHSDPPEGNPVNIGALVRVYFDAQRVRVPRVIGETPAVASERLRGADLGMAFQSAAPGSGQPGTVANQTPEPESWVDRGTQVEVFVVPDRLTVTADPPTPAVFDTVVAEAFLEPPRPGALYSFSWGDGSEPSEPSPERTASYRYSTAGPHSITVTATDSSGEMKVTSERDINVRDYDVRLSVDPVNPEPGQSVTVRAALDPASQGLTYQFSFDGVQDGSQSSPETTHMFSSREPHTVAVAVRVGDQTVATASFSVVMAPASASSDSPARPSDSRDHRYGPVFAGGAAVALAAAARSIVRKKRIRRLRDEMIIHLETDVGRQQAVPASPVDTEDVILVRAVASRGTQSLLTTAGGGRS
ncbi:MAG: PASTA domain-containing protein [Acidobacteriia bacterium]|nr:PASTA domain-containing protein [Terriglobia bacterium]